MRPLLLLLFVFLTILLRCLVPAVDVPSPRLCAGNPALWRSSSVSPSRDTVSSYLDSGRPIDEQGVEDAFDLLHETNERVRTGIWVGDCFIYNNSSWRLNDCVGGEVTTMFHLDRPMYLLGYLACCPESCLSRSQGI